MFKLVPFSVTKILALNFYIFLNLLHWKKLFKLVCNPKFNYFLNQISWIVGEVYHIQKKGVFSVSLLTITMVFTVFGPTPLFSACKVEMLLSFIFSTIGKKCLQSIIQNLWRRSSTFFDVFRSFFVVLIGSQFAAASLNHYF